jgi:hypothetical protein
MAKVFELHEGPEKQSEQNPEQLKQSLDNFFNNKYRQALHSAEYVTKNFVFTVETNFIFTERTCMCGYHIGMLIAVFNFFGHFISPWHQLPFLAFNSLIIVRNEVKRNEAECQEGIYLPFLVLRAIDLTFPFFIIY